MIPGLMSKISQSTVASATTIDVKTDLILLTGSTAVNIIKAPPHQGGFGTVIYIVPTDGTVATTTTGNIPIAVTMAQNRVTVFVYCRSTGKWYPGAIS